jgi:hypothetical protein
MTRRTVLTILTLIDIIAVVALVAVGWSGGGGGTAGPLAGAVVLLTMSLVAVLMVSRGARPVGPESVGPPHPTRGDVEFRDRGDRFGPP